MTFEEYNEIGLLSERDPEEFERLPNEIKKAFFEMRQERSKRFCLDVDMINIGGKSVAETADELSNENE